MQATKIQMDIQREPAQKKCQQIKLILEAIRRNIQEAGTRPIDPLQPFQQLMDLRELFRDVAMELQARRLLAKTKKEQIEKGRAYLDGLEYFKSMLKTQIDICQVNVEDISQILEERLDLEWADRFPALREKVQNWIQESKNQKQLLAEEKIRKQAAQAQVEKKKSLYRQELPAHLKKISQNLTEMVGVFGIEPVHLLNPIRNKKLVRIFNYFQPLKDAGEILMQYSEEMVSVTFFLRSNHKIYKLCEDIKCPIQQKSIKVNFLCILDDILVTGVDRSSDFNNQEIFHRLIDDEPITRLFSNPRTEEERNHNNRYLRFAWLDHIVNGRQNLELSSSQFVNKVVSRILALGLTRYLITSLKDNKFLFYFRVMRQGEGGSVHLKKFGVQTLLKIGFQQFKKLVHIPHWGQEPLKSQNISSSKSSDNSMSWIQFLTQLNLEQIKEPRMYQYYRVAMNFHQNVIVFLIILPFNYPEKQSVIKIIDISKKKEQRKSAVLPQPILSLVASDAGMSIQNQIYAESIQTELNENLSDFVNGNAHFSIFYQINRLLTLLEELHMAESNRECVISKLVEY